VWGRFLGPRTDLCVGEEIGKETISWGKSRVRCEIGVGKGKQRWQGCVGGGGGPCSGTRAAGGRLRFTWARARTRPAWGRGSDARRRPPGRRRGKGRGEERARGGRALGRGSGAPRPAGRSSAAGKRERPVVVGAGESRARGRAGESAAAGRSSTSGGEAPKLQTEFGVFLSFHSHLTEI